MIKLVNSRIIRINSLKLSKYRNHENLRINTDKNFILFYGPNGVGKTNILEAISILSSKSGFRNANLSSLIKNFDKKEIINFGINFQIFFDNEPVNIGIGLAEKRGKIQKFIKFENKNYKKKLGDILKVFWVLPNMNNLFIANAKERRDFIDSMISSFDSIHKKRIKIYENLQRQRISLLKEFSMNPQNLNWLNVIEKKMSSQAIIICEKRIHLFQSLNQILKKQKEKLPKIQIYTNSEIEERLICTPALKIEDEISDKLFSNRKIDGLIGKTQYSAINSDFKIKNFDKNTDAKDCSTGEQKVILLTLFFSFIKLLKHYKVTEIIFLLDDIFSNLDNRYVDLVLKSLRNLNIQTWITDIKMETINRDSQVYGDTKFINIEDMKVKN